LPAFPCTAGLRPVIRRIKLETKDCGLPRYYNQLAFRRADPSVAGSDPAETASLESAVADFVVRSRPVAVHIRLAAAQTAPMAGRDSAD